MMAKCLKIILISLYCLNTIDIAAQYKEKQIELERLKINKDAFLDVIDEIIIHEKRCNYYNCNLLFSINIKKGKNNFILSIESGRDINLLLPLNSYGYFYCQNHLFIVQGVKCKDIFLNLGTIKSFKYLDYNNRSDFKGKREKGRKISVYNNDSFSQWHYRYIDDKFILEDKLTFC